MMPMSPWAGPLNEKPARYAPASAQVNPACRKRLADLAVSRLDLTTLSWRAASGRR